MKSNRKLKSLILALLVTVTVLPGLLGQVDPGASSAIIGFQRVTVSEGWHAMGPPLEPFPVLRASAASLQQNVMTLDTTTLPAPMTPNQWTGYELVMESGLAAGHQYQIVGNGADFLALAAGNDPVADGVFAADQVSIAPTVEEYFGGQLLGGDANSSDWVAGFYQDNLVKLHRTSTGQWTDDNYKPAQLTVTSGRGFLISLLSVANSQPRTLFLAGQWNQDQGSGFIINGRQIVSIPLTGQQPPTLNSIIGPQGAGPVAGQGPTGSDQLSVLDDATGNYRTCWLDGKGLWRWQDTGDPAGALLIQPGRGYVYFHAGTGFSWRWR